MSQDFPPRIDNLYYLTEGGVETEVMYKWGYELPEFAMFPLLDNPEAHKVITAMYRRYMDVAAEFGVGIIIGSHDYRASPDWASKLGYDTRQLEDFQHRTIAFLAEIRAEYADRVQHAYIVGEIGPRGDAYGTGGEITEDEAESYHSVQLKTLADTEADMATAATFNNIAEAIGIVRAARQIGIPIGLSFNLGPNGRLRSGPSLREAIETVDAETGGSATWFGTNCSHPLEFEPALVEPGDWRNRLRYIRPNAAKIDKIALCSLGHLEDGNPVELGEQMAAVAKQFPRADIIGGCCGTDERHLREIARSLVEN